MLVVFFLNVTFGPSPPSVRGCRPGKIVQMTEAEVRGLCIKSREIFLSQPILLELEAPLKICGQFQRLPLDRPVGLVLFPAEIKTEYVQPQVTSMDSTQTC